MPFGLHITSSTRHRYKGTKYDEYPCWLAQYLTETTCHIATHDECPIAAANIVLSMAVRQLDDLSPSSCPGAV
jgi:hypothetical protein